LTAVSHRDSVRREVNVADDAASIDTTPIDALLQIKAKQDELQELVSRAERTRAKVSDVVYARVTEDYASRLRGLEAEARPLRKKAREEHARLEPIHQSRQRRVEEAQLDKEELEFRHEVGEVADEEFGGRIKTAEEVLAQRRKEFAETDDLKKRFMGVMGSPEPDDVRPEPTAPPAVEVVEGEDQAYLAGAATLAGHVPDLSKAAPAAAEGTLAMRLAHLILEGSNPPEEFQLGARTSIGRTSDNDIPINHASVSRHHAVVMLTENGYAIEDLKSGNGTFVNDERVGERRALATGDRVRIGQTAFVFSVPAD
jgi:hypothetical protein